MVMDEEKLARFWELNVPQEFKHYVGSKFDSKSEKCVRDARLNILDKIDFSGVDSGFEWGCGGGLISNELAKRCKAVGALDISRTSLEKCEEFLSRNGHELAEAVLLDSLDSLDIKNHYDLLVSVSVIQHFPSYEYFKRVVTKWMEMRPAWVGIQTRHGESVKYNEQEYFDGVRNYILGLIMPTDVVIESFASHYDVIYNYLDNDGYSMYEYFVFKRKAAV